MRPLRPMLTGATGSLWVPLDGSGTGSSLDLMGRDAVAMKWRRACGAVSGPRFKEKRRSLKLASHVRKKAEMPLRWMSEKVKGRMEKM